MQKIIEVTDLRKSYGSVEAVKGISFYVESGKLFSFLGPNGAGKSTTIDMICSLFKPDSGEITVDGKTVGKQDQAIRNSIGIVFQDGLLDSLLTVRENLKLRAAFYCKNSEETKQAVKKAIHITGIQDYADRPYGKLSGGQRRRADIARALLNTPKILFLDEPTTGLDPQTRKAIWETIERLRRENGMTIFLTTHYMEEAEKSDYVIVIDSGKIAARGTPACLKETFAKDTLRLIYKDQQQCAEVLKEMQADYQTEAGRFVVKITDTMEALPIIENVKDFIRSFEVLAGTMDDAFLGITGKELRE